MFTRRLLSALAASMIAWSFTVPAEAKLSDNKFVKGSKSAAKLVYNVASCTAVGTVLGAVIFVCTPFIGARTGLGIWQAERELEAKVAAPATPVAPAVK